MSTRQRQPAKRRRKGKNTQAVNLKLQLGKPGVQPAKRKRRRRNRARRAPVRMGRGPVDLSDCALKYAVAIGDPWNTEAINSCVPHPAGLTQKVTSYVRTTGFLNADGFAWIACTPTLGQDCTALFNTTNTYVNPNQDMDFGTTGLLATGVVQNFCTNLPYSANQFMPSIGNAQRTNAMCRIVSAGIRVRYIGPTIQEGGQVYTFRDPFHVSIQSGPNPRGTSNAGTFSARRECRIWNFNRNWRDEADFGFDSREQDMTSYSTTQNIFNTTDQQTAATMYPFCQGEYFYSDPTAGVNATQKFKTGPGNNVTVGVPTMGLFIFGSAGTQYAAEYVQHSEIGGSVVAAVGTRTVPDLKGSAEVTNAAAQVQAQGQGALPGEGAAGPTRLDSILQTVQSIQMGLSEHSGSIYTAARFAAHAARAYSNRVNPGFSSFGITEAKEP